MSLPAFPKSPKITSLQAEWCSQWHTQREPANLEGVLQLVEENHWRNFSLWHEEDEARREDIGAEGVYRAKRAIDGYNQERNNFIEKMDQFWVELLKPSQSAEVPRNSETPGMIIDRLSILSLKEYHMAEEVERESASQEHRDRCFEKLSVIRQQLSDLGQALDDLLDAVQSGRRTFSVYFQFKMYNDPELNPKLYQDKQA